MCSCLRFTPYWPHLASHSFLLQEYSKNSNIIDPRGLSELIIVKCLLCVNAGH